MSCGTGKAEISIQDLEEQLSDAKKALVDRKYVKYDTQGHLFDYDIDFDRFLVDIDFILKEAKKLDEENEDDYRRA